MHMHLLTIAHKLLANVKKNAFFVKFYIHLKYYDQLFMPNKSLSNVAGGTAVAFLFWFVAVA